MIKLEDMFTRYYLSYLGEALSNETKIYNRMLNSGTAVKDDLKKAVQRSVIELCTAIIEAVKEN